MLYYACEDSKIVCVNDINININIGDNNHDDNKYDIKNSHKAVSDAREFSLDFLILILRSTISVSLSSI